MAFKSVEEFNDERYHDMFRLVDDKDSAEVYILYRSKKDELKADAHYIKSNAYTGYIHCCGKGCPACARHFRLDTKIFIPLYVVSQKDRAHGNTDYPVDKILFWDRNISFDRTLDQQVFYNYSAPIEYGFKITRNGESRDRNTRFDITAIGTNKSLTYDAILAKFNVKMPDYYSTIIKEFSIDELEEMLQNSNTTPASDLPEYTPVPRAGYQSSIPNTYVNAQEAVNPASAESPISSDFETLNSTEDLGDEEFPEPEF